MCKITGTVRPINEAQRFEENRGRLNFPSFYTYYWRTDRGQIRKTGYVWYCACGRSQRWGRTIKEATEKGLN